MANVRIPQLTPSIGLSGTEELEIAVPIGSPVTSYESRRTTAQDIANLASGGGGVTGSFVYVTDDTPLTVDATVGFVFFDKAIAGASSITLGPTSARNGLPLYIFDFSGNSGDITITPDAADTGGIMGVATFTILSGGSLLLVPGADVLGWGAMA